MYALYAREDRWKYVLYLRAVEETDSDPKDRETPSTGLALAARLAVPLVRARGDEELFDLEADPYEQADLSGRPEHAAQLQRLRRGVLAWWEETGGGALDLP